MTHQVDLPMSGVVLREVAFERVAQDRKWGVQNHDDGTGVAFAAEAFQWKSSCDSLFAEGLGTWSLILLEEVYEALAESDPALLRAELIQVAAVATAWVEAIDRRRDPDQ